MTEQIEVPVRAEIPLSKYLARIPKSLFMKGRSHCDSKGISINTLIILALREYLELDEIQADTQSELAKLFKNELAAMEGRLLQALKPTTYTVNVADEETAFCSELIRRVSENVRMASTREGASLVMPGRGVHAPSLGSRGVRLAELTVPGALDWDNPAAQHRLWPDSPPLKGLTPEPLRGQVWVVTGDFDTMTTSRVREILQQAGAVVATTVNKKTSAVLAGISGESEKLDTAEARMLPIWTELQFLHMAKFIGADVRIPE